MASQYGSRGGSLVFVIVASVHLCVLEHSWGAKLLEKCFGNIYNQNSTYNTEEATLSSGYGKEPEAFPDSARDCVTLGNLLNPSGFFGL